MSADGVAGDPNQWLWDEGRRLIDLNVPSHTWRIVIVFRDGTTAMGDCDAFYELQEHIFALMTEKKEVALINIW